MKNVFYNELIKRTTTESSVYNVIGAEIKARRINKAYTLKYVSENICSLSYLCKLENSLIIPNPSFISKICDRVDLSEEALKKLFNLDKYIKSIIEAFYNDDEKTIIEVYKTVSDFDNYRVYIIRLIYFIYYKDFDLAKNLHDKLEKLSKSMDNNDLSYVAVFSAIYKIETNEYFDSIRILQSIVKKNYSECITALAYEYLLKGYYLTDSKQFLLTIDKTIDYNRQMHNYKRIDNNLYMVSKYYLNNNLITEFIEIYGKMQNTKYYDTLSLLYSIYQMKPLKMGIELNRFISPFYEMLYLYYTDIAKYKIRMKVLDKRYSELELLYLHYLDIKDNDEASYIEYSLSLYPNALRLNCIFLIKEISMQLARLYSKHKKYKQASEVMRKSNIAINKIMEI